MLARLRTSVSCLRRAGRTAIDAHQAKGNLQDVALKGKVDEAVEEALHLALAAAEERLRLAGTDVVLVARHRGPAMHDAAHPDPQTHSAQL